jgi:dihydropteroate synthase
MLVELQACGRSLRLGERPWLMGIVNASPDSFSDGGKHPTLAAQVELARELLHDGADIIDIGGESGRTNLPAVAAEEEIARVVPLIERVAGELGALVSVDTYKPVVAQAAIAAGAAIVNDVSGLRDVALADVCAASGAALVLMHTRAQPKRRLQDPALYEAPDRGSGDVLADVTAFLAERIGLAQARGVAFEQLIVDPGPDFSKTPAQTLAVLRGTAQLHALGRPLLMALSRKDFIGAITDRSPRERGAGTLAALAFGLDAGAQIFRVHDVAAASDFIAVRAALRGEHELAREARLAEELRSEPPTK